MAETQEAPKTKTTTTSSAAKPIVNEAELKKQLAKAAQTFKEEEKVKVRIPEVLKSSIGKTLLVGVNGVFVNIPVDGKSYELPKTFADHVDTYLNNLKP